MVRARRIQNGVLGVALLGELIFLIGHPLFGWGPNRTSLAPTPSALSFIAPGPPDARPTLLELAGVASRSPESPDRGPYAYVSRLVWSLADQSARTAHPGRPLIRTVRSWRAADGAGLRITVRRTDHGVQTVRTILPAGAALPSLAGGQTELAHRLHLGDPSPTPFAGEFELVTDVFADEPVPPAARAAILRLLAQIPGTVVSGATADRLGRRGVAVSLTSGASGNLVRYTLVLDRRTGGLLESDETLVGDPSASHPLNVSAGSLLAYTVYGAAGRTTRPGSLPPGPTTP